MFTLNKHDLSTFEHLLPSSDIIQSSSSSSETTVAQLIEKRIQKLTRQCFDTKAYNQHIEQWFIENSEKDQDNKQEEKEEKKDELKIEEIKSLNEFISVLTDENEENKSYNKLFDEYIKSFVILTNSEKKSDISKYLFETFQFEYGEYIKKILSKTYPNLKLQHHKSYMKIRPKRYLKSVIYRKECI
eukprot:970583_1